MSSKHFKGKDVVSLNRSALTQHLVKGISWNLIASVLSQGSVFAGAIIAARLLGKDVFGQYSIVQSTTLMLTAVAGAGLGTTATKYISQYRKSNPSRAGAILGLCSMVSTATSILFALALLCFAPFIATHLLNAGQLVGSIRLTAPYFFFSTLNGYQIGALVGFESFSDLAWMNLLQGMFSLVCSFFLMKYLSLYGGLLNLDLSTFFSWMVNSLVVRSECKRHAMRTDFAGGWLERNVLFKFTFPAATAGILYGLSMWCGSAILTRGPHGFTQLAIYNVAYNFRNAIIFVPVLITRVISPVLSSLIGGEQSRTFRGLFWTNVLLNAGIALILSLALYLLAPVVLKVFGKSYQDAFGVALLICIGSVLEVTSSALYQTLFSYGKMYVQLLIVLTYGSVFVIGAAIETRQFGALGLAMAYLQTQVASLLLYFLAHLHITRRSGSRLHRVTEE